MQPHPPPGRTLRGPRPADPIRLKRRLNALPQQIITITHDPATVAGANRILWLDQGRIRADGPPASVLPLFTAEMTRAGESDADTALQ